MCVCVCVCVCVLVGVFLHSVHYNPSFYRSQPVITIVIKPKPRRRSYITQTDIQFGCLVSCFDLCLWWCWDHPPYTEQKFPLKYCTESKITFSTFHDGFRLYQLNSGFVCYTTIYVQMAIRNLVSFFLCSFFIFLPYSPPFPFSKSFFLGLLSFSLYLVGVTT
jgi:hypothetical protein